MFVCSLNRVRRMLAALPTTSSPSPILDDFKRRIPGLIGVRDSSEHADERLQGRAHDVPLTTPLIQLENLEDTTLVSTVADGTCSRVAITRATLIEAVSCVQAAIDSFSWFGPARVVLI